MNQFGQGQQIQIQLQRVIDPRTPLGKLRRRQLYAYADHFDVPYSPGEGAESVRQKLQLKGIQGTELSQMPEQAPVKQLSVENPEQPDYTHVSMPELRKLCKQRGLKQSIRDKKPDLIRKLTDGQVPAERRE